MKKCCQCLVLLLLMGDFALAGDIFPKDPQWLVVRGDTLAFQQTNELLRLDARMSLPGVLVRTRDFTINPLQNYRFAVQVHRLYGDMPFPLNLCWIDQKGHVLSQEYNLMGKLIGMDWEPYVIEAIAPEAARFARVFISNCVSEFIYPFKNSY